MRLRCSLAIAWMMIVAVSLVNSANADKMSQGGANNDEVDETIGALFDRSGSRSLRDSGLFDDDEVAGTTTERFIDSNRAIGNPNNVRAPARKSLLDMSGPEILQDSDNLIDSDSNAPHVRVKRVANLLDSPQRTIPIRPAVKSSLPYIAQRRGYKKMYKRFSPEETNPADESETEYANAFDDDVEVDVPGAFFNDEDSKKRNKLEDVYPEVTGFPSPQARNPSDSRNRRTFSQPHTSQRRRSLNPEDLVRRKRDRGELAEEEEETEEEEEMAGDAEAVCPGNEEAEEEENAVYYEDEEAPETSNRRADSRAAAASRPILPAAAPARRISTAKEPIVNPQSHGYNANLAPSGVNSNAKEKDYRRSPVKEAALSSKSAASSLKKKTTEKKSKSKKKPPQKKKKPKRTASSSVSSSSSLTKSAKVDASEECVEETEEEEAAVDERERQKRNKSIIVKAIPRGDGAKEFQISQKVVNSSAKKIESVKKPVAAAEMVNGANKNRAQGEKAGPSIGEVKDLLGKLIVKVDGLHNLMSEIRNTRDSRLQFSNEETTVCRCWSVWTGWSGCSVTCGHGTESRSRRCLDIDNGELTAENQERVCRLADCLPDSKFLGIF